MASRRITRDTFEAVVQDKVKRYRMERSDAVGDSIHHFKAHCRPLARPRYNESFPDDGRFPHANSQHQEWSEDPREDYPREDYPREDYPREENYPRENYPGQKNYPGPSYRAGSPLLRKENYFHGQFSRREREFGRDYGRPGAAPSREFPPGREYGHHPPGAAQSREYGQHGRDYGHHDSWEAHGAEFGSPAEVLGDFRSPGLMEEEFGGAEEQEYEGEFRPPLRRGAGAGRGRLLRGKRLARGAVKPKAFKGDPKSPLRKWNVKKPQPGLDPNALDQSLDISERPNQRPTPLQQQQQQQQLPKLPPHPLAAQRPLLRLPKPTHAPRTLSFDLVDKSDIFSSFGVEIIKWAGFHAIRNDAEFSRLFGALFELETETCAKMLASFKCSLRPEHRDYCFFTIKSLQHAALKTPKVDNEFLNMLLDKGAVKTKNCFFEIIKPFDKYIMRLQDRLLKGVTPLLMACNAYELSLKTSGFGDPRDMAGAFETTVSLCRKSLALLGQTFALASVFRQEKILEAVGLQEMAPAPTAFPNFDDSTLFGREYIENLKAWLERSGYPIQMKRAEGGEGAEQLKAASPDSKAPQRADRKVVDTIEQLVSSIVSGALSAKDRNAQKSCPEYWFLSDEESLEYKYFRLRLAEVQRKSLGEEGAAPEALRALLYARRAASIKRKLFGKRKKPGILHSLRPNRSRRGRRASTGTQPGLRRQEKILQGLEKEKGSQQNSSVGRQSPALDGTSGSQSAPGSGIPEGKTEHRGLEGAAEMSPALGARFPDVDAKTMETAEKLAKFVAQVGPEIEQFSIDNSADNPDLWFLQDRSSSAFRFYRQRLRELCPSITFGPTAAQTPRAPQGEEEDEEDEKEEEEEEEEEEAEFETSQPLPDQDDDDEEEEDDDDAMAAGGRVSSPQQELAAGAAEQLEAAGAGTAEELTAAAGAAAAAAGAGQPQGPTDGAAPNPWAQAPPPAPGAPFPRKRVSSKSLRVGMIPASKRVCLIEEPKVHEPVRIAYDRPRGCPLTKKKKKSKGVELPQKRLSPRNKSKGVELPQKRLSPRNVGFRMLQRMGWQEGHGLGTRGRGIREPLGLGPTSAGEGLGVVGEEPPEDAFEIFRQRMIQMYRQKRASK